MGKNDAKTQVTDQKVEDFVNAIDDDRRKQDALDLIDLMADVTGEPPLMWGPSIIGFGSYHFKYESGREGDFMTCGFSPRKGKHSIYIMASFDQFPELMERLGKYTTGKSCLYIKKLEDVDRGVLRQLVEESVDYIKNKQWP